MLALLVLDLLRSVAAWGSWASILGLDFPEFVVVVRLNLRKVGVLLRVWPTLLYWPLYITNF